MFVSSSSEVSSSYESEDLEQIPDAVILENDDDNGAQDVIDIMNDEDTNDDDNNLKNNSTCKGSMEEDLSPNRSKTNNRVIAANEKTKNLLLSL